MSLESRTTVAVAEIMPSQERISQNVGATAFELLARPYDITTVVAGEDKPVPTFQPTQHTTREDGKLIGIDFDTEPDR